MTADYSAAETTAVVSMSASAATRAIPAADNCKAECFCTPPYSFFLLFTKNLQKTVVILEKMCYNRYNCLMTGIICH